MEGRTRPPTRRHGLDAITVGVDEIQAPLGAGDLVKTIVLRRAVRRQRHGDVTGLDERQKGADGWETVLAVKGHNSAGADSRIREPPTPRGVLVEKLTVRALASTPR